ncbi:rod shape-determining protein MreD [Tropicimonas sp. S265A]|uniref:rod shape-determining protein MreD n=1 Tax=Tropicimonas sp. S265A TaxID=3415134 RepID=UPI003C7BF896
MAERANFQTWVLRALFLGLVLAILLHGLLPLDVGAPRIPGPDLILCLVLAWVQRRPDVLTAPLIAGTILLADFLLMRPPGLWAVLVLIGSEVLRRRAYRAEATPIVLEMGIVTVAIAGMMIAQRLILTILFVDQPPVTAEMLHFLTTVAAYPVVAVASVYVFGIRAHTGDDGGLRT